MIVKCTSIVQQLLEIRLINVVNIRKSKILNVRTQTNTSHRYRKSKVELGLLSKI